MQSVIRSLRYFRDAMPLRIVPALISTAVLLIIWCLPVPVGLTPKAWGMVAIFLTTIVAIILKVMPIGVMALMPIIFGSGYVSLGLWWRVGFVMAVFELAVFATVGLLWWKVLGFW